MILIESINNFHERDNTMNLPQYQAFLKVVETGSFTKAAEELGYTQSGITHQIQMLEKSLQVSLLKRDRSGISLTAEGQVLLPYIRNLRTDEAALQQRAMELVHGNSGLIRLAALPEVTRCWLPGIISQFSRAHPQVQFQLFSGTGKECIALVQKGSADLCIAALPAEAGLKTMFLKRDFLMAVLPAGKTKEETIRRTALKKLPLIRTSPDYLEGLFRGEPIVPVFQVPDSVSLIAMVQEGIGCGVLSEMELKQTGKGIACCRLEPSTYRDLALMHADANPLSKAAEEFAQAAQVWISRR